MIKKGKLFISGGGKAKESFLLDREFVNSLKNKKILYIPIGLERDFIGYEGCYDWINTTLSVHSNYLLNITMWIDLNNKKISDVQSFDAIYLGGGRNTYKFLQLIYDTKFYDILRNFINKGGSIYGGSAGAIIMGKNIATVSEENDNNYTCEEGLGFVGNYSLLCHYDSTQDEKIKKYISNYKTPVIALPENSGLVVEKNNILVLGYNKVAIFDLEANKKFIRPDEIFVL